MKLLLPKAASEQARWLTALDKLPADIVCLDPWLITELESTAEVKNIWLNLDQFAGVICISPTAAKVLTEALDNYWPMPPAEVHWLCNGPRTAKVLTEFGLPAQYPDQGHTAEDVLALPVTQPMAHDKWLIVKGEGGRVTFAQTLSERGAEVTSLPVYQRAVNVDVLAQMARQASQCQALWLSSEFLGEAMLNQQGDFWRNWPGQWWVSSPRLLQWAKERQLKKILNAQGATLAALQKMIADAAAINEEGEQ